VVRVATHPAAPSVPKPSVDKVGGASVPWSAIISSVLKYVLFEHPLKCGCQVGSGARCCQTMQTIRLLLSMSGSNKDDDATSEEDSATAVTSWPTVCLIMDSSVLIPFGFWDCIISL
jgi:hypothetical protein